MAALPDRVGLKEPLHMVFELSHPDDGPHRACSEQSGACPLSWIVSHGAF